MNISLGDDLRDFVEREVREGAFSSSSEEVRHLLREKREESQLRAKLVEGLDSLTLEASAEELFQELREAVLSDRPVGSV